MAAFCLGLANSNPARADDAALTAQHMREDLVFLRDIWAPQDRSFSDSQRAAFARQVDATIAASDTLSKESFALEIMKAVAIARNGHTNANVGGALGPDLPIRAWLFSDGLHIVKTHRAFGHLLGARIDRIGTLSTDEAFDRVKTYLAGTDQRIRFLAPGFLVTPSVLKHIGAIEDTAAVALTLRLADGTARRVELVATEADPGDERKANLPRGYGVLIPDETDLPGRWKHVLDGRGNLPPIYGARHDLQSRFLGAGNEMLYMRTDMIRSEDDVPLADKFAGMLHQKVLPVRPRNIVVDLRFNPGGDFFNTILFSQALPRLVPPDGRVFVLVGRGTFSAAISTAAMLKGAGGGKVVLVGEAMGDAAQFWAEGNRIELPHSRIGVRYSPEFHDYEAGCPEIGDCFWALVAFGPRGISIAPEVKVDLSFEAYAAGRDPVLEKVRELAAAGSRQ